MDQTELFLEMEGAYEEKMANCKLCKKECPREKGKRSSKFYCSDMCYLMKTVEKQINGCWLSKTSIRKDGYSSLKRENKEILAHRLSYQLHKNKIPKDKLVCHTCDVRNCINPDHLYLGNDSINALDRQKRNKSCSQIGEKNHRAKLSKEDVINIRKKLNNGISQKQISSEYKISKTTVSLIKLRKLWGHL